MARILFIRDGMRRCVRLMQCKQVNTMEQINIAALQFSLEYLSLEIYVAGCKAPHCPGCHNSDLWKFEAGSPYSEWEFRIRMFASEYGGEIPLIQNIWVLGGEPLDQDTEALEQLLSTLYAVFPRARLWLWTRYEVEYVPAQILRLCNYIKTGPYIASKQSRCVSIDGYRMTLGSDNQKIYRVINGDLDDER